MDSARLIICENTRRWAVWIRLSTDVRAYETRTLTDCWDQVKQSPASFLVLELTPSNIESIIEFLPRVKRSCSDAQTAVVGNPDAGRYEWLVREAGAVEAVFSPRRLKPLTRIVRRHFRALLVNNEQTLTERIRERLPWGIAEQR